MSGCPDVFRWKGNLEAAKAVVDLPIGIRQQSGAYLSFSLAWPPKVRSLSGEREQQFDMVDSLSRESIFRFGLGLSGIFPTG